jgi:hypothetical protein
MGWDTYIVNETGRDLYCFWATSTGVTDFPGWDVVNFLVPAGHNCASNRGGLCLFGLGAMFQPYPVPTNVVGSGPLGTPTVVGGQPVPPSGPLPFPTISVDHLGGALKGIPLLWGNYDSSLGNACSSWGFRIQLNPQGYEHTFNAFSGPSTTWTYPGPTPLLVQTQGWTAGPGMYATYPASTSGCNPAPAPVPAGEIGI